MIYMYQNCDGQFNSTQLIYNHNFRLCQLCNGSWVDRSLRQHGRSEKLSDKYTAASLSIVMEGETVDINVRLSRS